MTGFYFSAGLVLLLLIAVFIWHVFAHDGIMI